MNIVNVGYQSTHYYVIDTRGGKLLIDCGWPGTLPQLTAELKRTGIALQDIKYLLVTHFHPDHAGLTQELKSLGVLHLLLDVQMVFVSRMTEFFKNRKFPYVPIQTKDSTHLKVNESRKFLAGLGLNGEILHTPGHSDDSVTLILDEGYAFTGDLQPVFFLPEDDPVSRQSWDKIHRHQIIKILPSHGKLT